MAFSKIIKDFSSELQLEGFQVSEDKSKDQKKLIQDGRHKGDSNFGNKAIQKVALKCEIKKQKIKMASG